MKKDNNKKEEKYMAIGLSLGMCTCMLVGSFIKKGK